MRKLSANLIFTTSAILKQGYIIINNAGLIIEVVETNGQIPEIAGLEYYPGILIPGLIINKRNNTNPIQFNKHFIASNLQYRVLWQKGIQCITDINDLEEIKKINIIELLKREQKNDSSTFAETINKYTIENAQNLALTSKLGSISRGKNPGILHISGYNFKTDQLNDNAIIQRLE